jgi:hypothetical protein
MACSRVQISKCRLMRPRQSVPSSRLCTAHHRRQPAGLEPVEVRVMGREDEENILIQAFELG